MDDGHNSGVGGDETQWNKSSNFAIETYRDLKEATAERFRRFTKAVFMRNTHSELSPATAELGRTISGIVVIISATYQWNKIRCFNSKFYPVE